jgi:hypothetical protein
VASSIRIKARKSRSSGSGEHSIDAVTVASFEVIAIHPMLGLRVANDWLDRSAATHLAADRGGDAAHLAADPDAEFLGVVVAAIAFVDPASVTVDAAWFTPYRARPYLSAQRRRCRRQPNDELFDRASLYRHVH